MDFLIIFIKCLVIVLINISLGWLISYLWHFYLFYPRKIFLFGKYPFFYSPGLLYRGKQKLIKYLHQKLNEYLEYAKSDYGNVNFLTEFEKNAYNEIFPYIKKFINIDWLPSFLTNRINEVLSSILWIVIRHLTRGVIPRIFIELQVECKIDLLDIKLDINMLKKMFEQHIYKYFMWFNMCFLGLVGLINMIVFLILK